MIKLDKDRNVTQEYLDYVSKLKREDLERFYIGADLLVDRLNNIIKEVREYIENSYNGMIIVKEELLEILDKEKE